VSDYFTMPILPISNGQGELLSDGYVEAHILATQAYPNDPVKRAELYDGLFLTAPGTDVWLPDRSADVERLLRPQRYGIYVTGGLLLLMLKMASTAPHRASLNLAVSAWNQAHALHRPNGRIFPASRAPVLKAWSEFKSVSHLIAAYELTRDQHPLTHIPWNQHPISTRISWWLIFAEEFLRIGENYYPLIGHTRSNPPGPDTNIGKRTAPTLLDPSTTWKLPPDLYFPPLKGFTIPPLDDVLNRFVKEATPR
jgi:hypothetical protein